MLGTNRARIAFRQVDLAFIRQDVFTRQLGGVRMFSVFIDDGAVARSDGTVGRDHHFVAVFVDLIAVVQTVKVPHHRHLNFAFFNVGNHRIGHAKTAFFRQIAEEAQRRFHILLVTA